MLNKLSTSCSSEPHKQNFVGSQHLIMFEGYLIHSCNSCSSYSQHTCIFSNFLIFPFSQFVVARWLVGFQFCILHDYLNLLKDRNEPSICYCLQYSYDQLCQWTMKSQHSSCAYRKSMSIVILIGLRGNTISILENLMTVKR